MVLDKLKWERQDAAARSLSRQLLDRSDLTIDALLACPTQPPCPTVTIPIFNLNFMKSNIQENQGASQEEAKPTAQNPSSQVNQGFLSTNDALVAKGGGPLTTREAPAGPLISRLISRITYGRKQGFFGQKFGERRWPTGVTEAQHSGDVERDIYTADTKAEFYTTLSPFEAKPRNTKEAHALNCWPQYFDEEHEEMVNHQENGTWSLVPCHSVPKRAKVLRTKWVYDDKKGLYAMIVQVTPRLTAMGNVQREGVG